MPQPTRPPQPNGRDRAAGARQRPAQRLPALALVVLATVAASGTRAQADYCITCQDPAATYVCAVDENVSAGASLGGAPLGNQLRCIEAMAREGGHASCAVSISGPSGCQGPVHKLPPVTPHPPGWGTGAGIAKDAGAKQPVQNAPIAQPAETSPSNLMTRAGAALGNAVGNAVKGSWNCVTSLFKTC